MEWKKAERIGLMTSQQFSVHFPINQKTAEILLEQPKKKLQIFYDLNDEFIKQRVVIERRKTSSHFLTNFFFLSHWSHSVHYTVLKKYLSYLVFQMSNHSDDKIYFRLF